MGVTLAEQGFVHKGIPHENVSQQPTILILARTAGFKADGFIFDQTAVRKRRFLSVRVPLLWRIDAEIAKATAVFQTTGIPVNNSGDGDGFGASLGLNRLLE